MLQNMFKIVLSRPNTFLINSTGEKLLKKLRKRKFTLGDHILNSHDLRG